MGDALRKSALNFAQVFLEPAYHDVVEKLFAADRHAAAEALRVENFKQRGEAVGMAVVGRGGEEKAMLESPGQLAHGLGDFGIDGVFCAAGRRGVMGFVKDEQ